MCPSPTAFRKVRQQVAVVNLRFLDEALLTSLSRSPRPGGPYDVAACHGVHAIHARRLVSVPFRVRASKKSYRGGVADGWDAFSCGGFGLEHLN